MKYAEARPYSDPAKAAHRLLEHAQAFESIQDGRIYIEKINGPFLFGDKATPAEYSAGLKFAIERGVAGVARVRDLRPVHSGRGRVVRMIARQTTPARIRHAALKAANPIGGFSRRGDEGQKTGSTEPIPKTRDRELHPVLLTPA